MNDDVQVEDDDLLRNQPLESNSDQDETGQSGITPDPEQFGLDPNFREALKTNEDFRRGFLKEKRFLLYNDF